MTSPDGDNLTYEKFETGLLPALSIHIEPSMSHKLFDALLPAGNFDAITLNALKVGLEAMREEARDRLVIDDLQLALSRNAPQLDTLFRCELDTTPLAPTLLRT